ncbi:MAG: ABC transporter permease [Vicinamibacterales bacterium]
MKISELWRRLRVFLRRDEWTQELDDEMRLHVELRAQLNRDRGMAPADAELAAKRRFGNPLVLRENTRDVWTTQWLESMWKDVTYSMRRLARDRAATTAIVLTLAVGIGANCAMFTLIDTVLFKPAPVSNPDSLAWLQVTQARSGRLRKLSYPDYKRFAQQSEAFDGVASFDARQMSLGGDTPERIRGMVVSGNYFDVLGVSAAKGRTFLPEEDGAPGAHPVTVLSHALWTNRFGADASIIDRPVTINGRRFTVVGVAPPGFGGLSIEPVALWVPLAMTTAAIPDQKGLLESTDGQWLYAVGRVKAGVSFARASALLQAISRQLGSVTDDDPVRVLVQRVTGGLDPENRREMGPVFGLLSIVPLLVLVVACANVANLLLSRGLSRRKELALRKALGAARSRLVRQLLVESVILSMAACVVGLLVAYGLTSVVAVLAEVPAEIRDGLAPDARVLTASLVLAILAGITFGVAPALASTDTALVPSLKDTDLGLHSGDRRHRLRSAFLVTQVTVSFVLVVVAGLFLQSVSKAMSVDPGFDAHNVVVLAFDPDLQGYDNDGRQRLTGDVLRSVQALPGVESAALSTSPPLAGLMYGAVVSKEGAESEMSNANFAGISPKYFETMKIPVLAGRDFTPADTRASTKVVMINDTLASRLWPGLNPLGKRLRVLGAGAEDWREVVGVVKGGKYDEFTENPRPFLFLPDAQLPMGRISLLARTAIDAAPMVETVRRTVRTIDPDMPLFDGATLEQTIRNAVDQERGTSFMLAAFGVLGLFLAAFGLYAVTSQAVALRVREIGIRIALGARASTVARQFVRESLSLCAVGLAIGTVLSLALSGVLGAFLFGLAPSDVLTYIGSTALFGAVAALATLIPARRAASVDPLRSLRSE